MLARGGIGELSLARKLIAFLSVLAPTLAVALAGDHRRAAAFAPDMAGGEHDIDHGKTVFHALRLMFEPTRVHRNRAIGFRKPMRGFLDIFWRNASHGGGSLRVPVRHGVLHRDKTGCVLCDELLVLKPITQNHVQHSLQERKIRSGTNR
jgi:hypothetical protein